MVQGLMANKIVLVVGGGHATGAGIIYALLQSQATVIAPLPNKQSILQLREAVDRANERRLITFPTDFGDYEKAEELIEIIVASYGHIDLVVSAVEKITGQAPLLDSDIREWHRAVDCNMTTTFIIDRLCLPLLGKNGGMLINITNADHLLPGAASPMARLFGLGGLEMSKVFAAEARQHHIHYYHLLINNVGPIPAERHHAGEREITTEMIGAELIRLYTTNSNTPGQTFHFLTGKAIDADLLNRLKAA